MDKKQLEDISTPSVMERMNEIQRQIDPLHQIKNSSKISDMMEQNARVSSAANIGAIARKAFQQAGLDFTSFENQSTIARAADLGFQNTLVLQDTFLKSRKELTAYSDTLSVKERMLQGIEGANVYKDVRASLNQFKKSVETFRSSFNAAHSVFGTGEISRLVRDIQSHKAMTNLILSDYAGVFKQVESLQNLESFKAIFRLNDFQFEEVISTNLTQEDITSFSEKSTSEIDSDLSDEIKLGKDFDLYVEEDKKYLSYIYHYYLLPFMFLIMGILIAPHIQQAQAELDILTTQQEVKAFTRSPPYTFDRQALKGHRFTTVNLLNLRDKPSMHSNVIDSLPIGTIARVVNKSDRSWLLVEIEMNGELEQGWILRRYTTYFK